MHLENYLSQTWPANFGDETNQTVGFVVSVSLQQIIDAGISFRHGSPACVVLDRHATKSWADFN